MARDLVEALGGQSVSTGTGAALWTILCRAHKPAIARLCERRGSLAASVLPISFIALAWTESSLAREEPAEPVHM